MIDWYVREWVKHQTVESLQCSPVGGMTAQKAITHPRAWESTLERLYVCYGREDWWLRGVLVGAVSCPDWVRRDVLARGDEWLIHVAATWCSNVPPGFARALADKGRWWDAVACLSAPSDVLVEAVEPLVAEAKDKQSRRNVLSRVITHGNFPPEVRREVAPWLKTSLWAVARDGFLGRS